MNPRYWRMPEGGGAVIETPKDQLEYWNEQCFGIFWTWNDYNGTRSEENLTKINAWAVDIDGSDKESQFEIITKSPLIPSLVRESKNGFHVYFFAKTSSLKNFKKIMVGLQDTFSADRKALDGARILREKNFFHWKDLNEPFLVKDVFNRDIYYHEKEMLECFGEQKRVQKFFEDESVFKAHSTNGNTVWDKVYNLDCKKELEKLSGNPLVGGEKYTFQKQRNGNWNIFVDGKSTSCFVDRAGRIGSADGGGPTIYRWLLWYIKDKKKTVEAMKILYPELGW